MTNCQYFYDFYYKLALEMTKSKLLAIDPRHLRSCVGTCNNEELHKDFCCPSPITEEEKLLVLNFDLSVKILKTCCVEIASSSAKMI